VLVVMPASDARDIPATETRRRWNIRNVLEWSVVDRTNLAAAIVLVFTSSYALAVYYYLRHPDLVPYADHALVEVIFRVQLWVYVGAWAAVLVAGLALRRVVPHSAALSLVVCLLYGGGFGVASYWLGHYTSLFTGVTLIGGGTIGFILFDRRFVLLGLATYVAIIVGTTIAEQLGLLPYGPALIDSPFRDGHLSGWWIASIGGVTLLLAIVVISVIDYIVAEWREHEQTLAETAEQLARAHELVSRYVAAQVTEQILAGNYDAVNRHDRRRLTLFFSDIVGFTTLADRMEPEDISELLNEYLSEMTAIAQNFGATVDKFIGDAMMIFFGAPRVTHEREHALQAVRMAIAMQQRIGELEVAWSRRSLLDAPFQVRMGINSGIASVGNFGSRERMDYTAVGRQVNLAARLQTACAPGRILLSHATWVLVHEDIPCTDQGDISVKGFERPVRVYQVAHAGSTPG
jgi:adenylate cyclase